MESFSASFPYFMRSHRIFLKKKRGVCGRYHYNTIVPAGTRLISRFRLLLSKPFLSVCPNLNRAKMPYARPQRNGFYRRYSCQIRFSFFSCSLKVVSSSSRFMLFSNSTRSSETPIFNSLTPMFLNILE